MSQEPLIFTMPPRSSSTSYRNRKADRILFNGFPIMRPCRYCLSRGFLCVVSNESEHCEQCFRSHKQCDLAPADAEIERLSAQVKDLAARARAAHAKAVESQAKAVRLAKQRRLALKKLREASARDDQNILKLEIDKMLDAGIGGKVSESFMNPTSLEGPPVPVSFGSSRGIPLSPLCSG